MSYNSEVCGNLAKKYGRATLTIEEAAVESGVEVCDIKDVIKSGELDVKKIGTKEIISIVSFLKFLAGEPVEPVVDITSKHTVTSNQTLVIVEDDVDMAKGTVAYIKQSNLWVIQIDIGKAANGKRIRKSASFETEEEAIEALEKERELLKSNSEGDASNFKVTTDKTVKDYLNYYLSLEQGRGGTRTRESYYFAAGKICDEIGEIKLGNVNPELIMGVLNAYKKKYSQSTLDKVYIVLNTAFKYAYESDILDKNLMKGISKPKSTRVKKDEYKAYSEDEINDLVTASKCYPEIRPVILLLLNTGMRPGELRGLKWDNIDFEEKTVFIKEAATLEFVNEEIGIKPKMKEVISRTKSSYSVRKLTVPEDVITELKMWRKYVNANKVYKKAINSKFVFPSPTGGFVGDSVLRNRYKKFLLKEGFDNGYTLYRFRHTMCTFLIKQGTDIPTVQRIMGDNTTDVILKIYTSVNAKDVKDASSKVQSILGQLSKPSYKISD